MSNEFKDWIMDATLEDMIIAYNNAVEAEQLWYAKEIRELIREKMKY